MSNKIRKTFERKMSHRLHRIPHLQQKKGWENISRMKTLSSDENIMAKCAEKETKKMVILIKHLHKQALMHLVDNKSNYLKN